MSDLPFSFADVEAAARRIKGVAGVTPVLTSRTADRRTGGMLYFKCENLQRSGAFKFRGAVNALKGLLEQGPLPGVVTYSSGNHAQALALAGKLLGIRVAVVMPQDAPLVKRNATEGYGAEVILYDRHTQEREVVGREVAESRGWPIVPPYDHPLVAAGQGTAALELIGTVGELDLILTPCGGGGLLSGTAVAAAQLLPGCAVIGVEPAAADDAARSFRTGVLHTVRNPETIADGARTPSLGTVTFPMIRHYVKDIVTVTDDAILEAVAFFLERMKIVVEPTGAMPLAAILSGIVDVRGKRVGLIVSGGNATVRLVIG